MSPSFLPLPTPEHIMQLHPWHQRPGLELGVPVPFQGLLAETRDVLLGIRHVRAYSTGFGFLLGYRTPTNAHNFHWGRRASPDMWEADREEMLPDELFRLGIEFAEGRAATSLEPYWSCRPEGPTFRSTGSANGDGRFSWDERWWVGPTPAHGRITLFCEWPAAGIPMTQMLLPADAIRAAAPPAG